MKEITIYDVKENVVDLLNHQWGLITAGKEGAYNTMTVSWGALGELWGRDMVTAYIRPQRYTREFLDNNECFTLSFYPAEYKKALAFCGSALPQTINSCIIQHEVVYSPFSEAIHLYIHIKRALDIVSSLFALILLFPVFLIIALVIKLTSPGPVFFTQTRVGLHKKHFRIYKFRTMSTDAPRNMPTHQLRNAYRFITPVGRFLRLSSLDELPQLINILKGEMSVVGPRPVVWKEFDLIAERDKYHANDVLPGLTGWAQINGRDTIPVDVKARLDGEYVARMSFLFDLRCVLGTFFKVLRQADVREGAQETPRQKDDSAA